MSVAVAQDSFQGYRFAPHTPAQGGGTGATTYGDDYYRQGQGYGWSDPVPPSYRQGQDYGWSDPVPPLTGPGGRPYRFRNGIDSSQVTQRPVFRPDTRLGQQPKNWSSDPNWASDPVLQQGLVFRPLGEKKAARKRDDPVERAASPAYPPAYPYAGAADLGVYPGLYGPGFPGDPALGAPLWPLPGGSLGGWAPAW